MIKASELISYLNTLQINMDIVPMDNFLSILEALSSSDKTQSKIIGIINDFTGENDLVYNHIIKTDNTITCKYLKNLNFNWPILNLEYFKKLLNYMLSVEFININQERKK